MKRKYWIAVSASLIGVAALAGGAWAAWKRAQMPERLSAVEPGNTPVVVVRAFTVERRPGRDAVRLTGVVRPRYETQVAFRVSGKVLRRFVEVGQQVQTGQLLFELDAEDFMLQQRTAQANVQVAQAAVIQAVAEEKRLRQLRSTNAISASEYERGLSDRDIALGRQESAQKQLQLADNQLAYCRLVADDAGLITAVHAEAGQVLALGAPVCTLAQQGELEAEIDIPENRRPQSGQMQTQATFWSLPDASCQATLRELSPAADPVTRTYRARFTLLRPPPQVMQGMTVTIDLPTAIGKAESDIEIPASAITRLGDGAGVWKIGQEGRISVIPVTVEGYREHKAVISAGLEGGERIVSAGVQRLDESMRVQVWDARS